MTDVLLIDEQAERGAEVVRALVDQGVDARCAATLPDDYQLRECSCVVCLDTLIGERLPDMTSLLPVVVLSEGASIPAAVTAIRQGAIDYLELPCELPTLLAAVERARTTPSAASRTSLENFPMIGSCEQMRELKESIAKVAPTDSTVLIQGPSGTGKELVARALHAASGRSGAPLISINCATVPQNLIEAELFGREPFDNHAGHAGLIDAAEAGTLFLDEVAELPSAAQARLLQVLQGENRRVGSAAAQPADVRIIAATHRDLGDSMRNGHFREDLYYRLNVVRLELPPLYKRQQDVIEIARWLLERTGKRLGKEDLAFSADAIEAMQNYHWPGNVRELENAVERAVILADTNGEISQTLLAIEPSTTASAPAESAQEGDQTSLEDYFVRFVLDHQDQYTETELAEKLGISRKSLWERRQRLNIPRRKTRKRGPRRDTPVA